MIDKLALDEIVKTLLDWCHDNENVQQDLYALLLSLSEIDGDKAFAKSINEIREAFKRRMK